MEYVQAAFQFFLKPSLKFVVKKLFNIIWERLKNKMIEYLERKNMKYHYIEQRHEHETNIQNIMIRLEGQAGIYPRLCDHI